MARRRSCTPRLRQRLLLLATLAAFLGLLAVVVSKGLFPVEAGFRPLPIAPQ